MPALRVLFTSSEIYPLIKTGGLADISYALPQALQQQDVDIRVLTIAYPTILDAVQTQCIYEEVHVFVGFDTVRLLKATLPNTEITLYLVDCPRLYQRVGNPYCDETGQDWEDNGLRFGMLAKVAAFFGSHYFDFKPDLIHCNDWQTGLTPAFLKYSCLNTTKTLMTIHNIAYQGIFDPTIMRDLNLPAESFNIFGLEYHGLLSYLKAGLYYSNWISTVSPTYATEIQTPEFGYGLYGLLAHRQHQLTGILNGIDTDIWHPATDPYLTAPYDKDHLAIKDENKIALCHYLGLAPQTNLPIIGMISRLTYQKGIDLILPIIPQILAEGAQLVILGTGEKELEHDLQTLMKKFPQQLSVTIGYNEKLAHWIEAGCDIFLMPSRFEPCGLNQMYSMQYGTLPLVHHTGGLADTVVNTTPKTIDKGIATGFSFTQNDSQHILQTIQHALLIFRNQALWKQVQWQAMSCDFSWTNSALSYLKLYKKITSKS